MKNIRNFCIIAHIDHGKSTLADRLLEYTKTISEREKQDQLLDDMDLERERGITIKSHAIQMDYVLDGEKYILNLIDTPGHVDFSYEVSRSIAACEGALLVVDAAQSIQAQTISNLYLALENGLTIIPVLNKIDLPSAKPEEVADDIVALIDCRPEDIIHASGKTGQGVEDILRAIVERIPAPVGDPDAPLQALVFDSVFNSFRGVEAYYKVVNGTIHQGEKVKFMATGKSYLADEVGTLKLKKQAKKQISAGDVSAYIPTNVISITDGQLFLESSLFFSGQRPAVNVGLSVSRVGGDAQTKAMKKAAGAMRLDLAQYREMEVFTQFSSDLDEATKRQLTYGQGLMRLLRQKQYHPLTQHEQVITLVAALNHVLQDIPASQIGGAQQEMLAWFAEQDPALCQRIDSTGLLSDDDRQQILALARVFVAQYQQKKGQ